MTFVNFASAKAVELLLLNATPLTVFNLWNLKKHEPCDNNITKILEVEKNVQPSGFGLHKSGETRGCIEGSARQFAVSDFLDDRVLTMIFSSMMFSLPIDVFILE
ncbi:MAG TPA: hypothetical protein VFI43_09250 [Nitrosospira sp.]|nr:hypothetical protein [Nitrosospira sp.]